MAAVLIQIDGYDPVAAQAVTLRLSNLNDERVCHLNGQTWWPVLLASPKLRYDLVDASFSGAIGTPASQMTFAAEPFPNLGRYQLSDARVQMWIGEPGQAWGSFTLRFDGRATAQPQIADGRARLAIAVDDRWLDTPLLSTYAGTGGAEGTSALKGRVKPLSLGAPRFARGELIDPVNIVLQLSAYGTIEDVETAFERILRFTASTGDHASYAALIAASIPAGRWATCKAAGMVRHGAPPAPGGRFTYHVRGDKAGPDGWVRLPGQVIKRIALLAGGTGRFSEASVDALDAARPYNISWHVTEQITAREAIQRIAASVNAVAGVSWLSQLFVAPLPTLPGTAAVTLRADGTTLPVAGPIEQIAMDPPFWRMGIETELTWDVHQLSDVAFSAPLVDRGNYSATETYREGNLVVNQGAQWLYINATPGQGNAPPTLPTTSNAWWKLWQGNLRTIDLKADRSVITLNSSGVPNPSSQTTNFTVEPTNLSSSSFTVSMTDQAGTVVNANTYLAATGGSTLTPSGNNAILTGGLTFAMTAANFNTARGTTSGVIVSVSHADLTTPARWDVVKAQDGAAGEPGDPGAPGANAKTLYLAADRVTITYSAAGSPSPSTQTTTFTVLPQNLSSSSYTISATDAAGNVINVNTYFSAAGGGSFTPSGNNAILTGSATFTLTAANFNTARGSSNGVIVTATHADGPFDKYNLNKSQDGATGDPGDPGDPGLNNATVELWQRNHTGVAPAVPTDTLTYTFATALLSGGSLNGWSQTIPAESGGAYLFKTTAVATGAGATDTIASGEWATVRLAAQTSVDENSLIIYDPMLYTSAAELDRAWTTVTGSGTVSSITDAESPGGQAMTIAGQRRLIANAMLAYDPAYLWEVTIEAEAASGSPGLYGGVAGRKADRTTLVNTSGANSSDQQHYVASSGAVPPTVWQSYIGYFSGKAGSGFSFPNADPLSPSRLHNDVAFVSPLLFPSEGGGTTALGYFRLQRLARAPMWRNGGTAMVLRDQYAKQFGVSDFAGVVWTPFASAKGGRVSAVIPTAASRGEIGFTDESTPAAGVQTKWAIRWDTDGNLDIYKNGSLAHSNVTTYTAGTKIEVVASIGVSSARWQFFKNDAEIGTPDTTMPGAAIRGKARLGAGSSVRELTASITGADGEDGENGATVSPGGMVFTIAAAANGTVKSGEFPKTVTFIVTRGGVDLSTDASVTYTWSNPSGVTASMGSGGTKNVLTATSMSALQTVTGTVTITLDGATIAEPDVTFVKMRDGYGSTPMGDDTLSINNSGSYSGAQGGPVTRTCGPGNVHMDVNHPYAASGSAGTLAGKGQYRTTPGAGAWTDMGSEVVSIGAIPLEPDVLAFRHSVAGPSSPENWEFQYVNRRSSGTGTLSTDGTGDVMTVSGEGT